MALKLNPNKEIVQQIIEEIKLHNGYCPCVIKQTEDTKCKCKEARENDNCVCGLFIKEDR